MGILWFCLSETWASRIVDSSVGHDFQVRHKFVSFATLRVLDGSVLGCFITNFSIFIILVRGFLKKMITEGNFLFYPWYIVRRTLRELCKYFCSVFCSNCKMKPVLPYKCSVFSLMVLPTCFYGWILHHETELFFNFFSALIIDLRSFRENMFLGWKGWFIRIKDRASMFISARWWLLICCAESTIIINISRSITLFHDIQDGFWNFSFS